MRFVFNWRRQRGVFMMSVFAALCGIAPAAFGQAAAPPPTIGTAFVSTVDFGDASASYSVIDLATQETFLDIVPNGINDDNLVRYDSSANLLYVVNSFGGDSVQVIDPELGYTTPLEAELSTGNGSNPQDIALISPDKAYVSRLASTELLIINPSTMTEIGSIDLTALVKQGDLDGSPEPYRMLVHGDSVYLILQHLNQFVPFAPGEVVVIDTATDMVTINPIVLSTRNPFTDLQFTATLPRGPRILVSSVGDFLMLDGGIEAIDPATNTVDADLVMTESDVNGNITFFEVVSPAQGYALVLSADGMFTTSLVQFNPSTGGLLSTLASGLASTSNFAINNKGHLYIGPNDKTSPGVRIFDTNLAVELTTDPMNMGALPPGWIVMVEEPQVALTVNKTGAGTVISLPVGLFCDPVCTQNFPTGAEVTLTATPDAGATFTGWEGSGCTGTGTCTVTLDQEKAVTATFE